MGQHSSTVNDTPCLRSMMLDRIEGENAVTKQKKERLLDLHIVRAITIEEFKERNDGLKNQLKAQESQQAAIRQEQSKASTQELDMETICKEVENN